MATIKVKRGTRSEINAAASASGLNQGELYLITDENVLAVGISTSTYEDINSAGLIDLTTDVTGTLATSNGGTGVTALSSLDAADLGSGAATDGYVLTADGAGGAAWEAASGGGASLPIDLLSSGASIRKSDGTTAILSESSGEVNLTNINLTSSVGNLPSNRNLIINGDFRVNQRGAASRTATTNAYNYDRWYYDGTYLYQVIEDLNIVNGDYTISWSGSGLTAGWVISSNTTSSIPASFNTVTSGSSFTVSGKTTGDHLWIRFGGTLANLADVQVEAGTVATPFERRLIGTELALCQRYYCKSNDYGTAPADQSDSKSVAVLIDMSSNLLRTDTILFPSRMRTSPTVTALEDGAITGGSGTWSWYQNGTWVDTTFTPSNISDRGYTAHAAGAGYSDGSAYFMHINWTADAEL